MPVDEKKIAGECPSCGSPDFALLENNDNYSSGTYVDILACNKCGEEWKEYFKYSGYDLIDEGEK